MPVAEAAVIDPDALEEVRRRIAKGENLDARELDERGDRNV